LRLELVYILCLLDELCPDSFFFKRPTMFAGLKSRVSGFRGGSTLDGELKQVTSSGVIDIPKDLLTPVCEASHTGEEARSKIMTHLRECLSDPSAKNWRKIYAALVLVEELMKSGAPALVAETAEGHHFDLVQRLSFLELFQQSADKRAEKTVRTKASALRLVLIQKLQHASSLDTGEAAKDTMSSCSAGAPSIASCSTAASSITITSTSISSEDSMRRPQTPEKPKGRMILNGIVAVGHSDDTTSEESCAENAPVRYSEPKRASRRERDGRQRRRDHSSDSDISTPRNSKKETKVVSAPPSAQNVNLLDF